ncbi:hypothetical protein KKB43_06730 [Patescibacteria group bacterium]|nr:hypothetical protein [Patescibacteria group bacterium]MBU4580673.1 hypothetical protein [Patescibacteria group bacterium]
MKINKTTSMKTFNELFETILTGNKDDSRKAAREVRKFLYSSHGDQYDSIKSIIENAPKEYGKIAEDWREENFVVAVSVLYFLHGREKQPDFIFPWLFYLLLNKNGNIRHAAVRMIEHEIGPLTVHIRFPNEKLSNRLGIKQADEILFNLFIKLNNLLVDYWKPAYKKYKYISSLPAIPYKSIQMVLGRMKEDCGETYIKRLESRLRESNK